METSVPSSYTEKRAETTHKGSRKEKKTWEMPLDLVISRTLVNYENAVLIKKWSEAEYRNSEVNSLR